MRKMSLIFVLSVVSTCLYSTIINVPADQPTIQEGIDAAVNADTVLVQPGTYVENINYNGKNITVASLFLTIQDTTYISQTVIDGDSIDSVVTFESGEDPSTLLTGFTITNGSACYWGGGGIYCNNSSPSLDNVTITGNSTSYHGGGIYCHHSNPSLINVTITNNSATGNYGVGGGIFCSFSSPSLVNVTISGNTASDYGGEIYCYNNSSPNLINSILWNDSPEEICFADWADPNSITISYSDIQGGEAGIVTNNNGTVNWLEGNIDEDPLFVGTGEHPYSLLEDSPCIDAGIPDTTGLNLPPWDIIGNLRIWDGDGDGIAIIDMGAYEYGAPPYVDVDDDIIIHTPEVFLNQNYPNPFNPETTIRFTTIERSPASDGNTEKNTELVIYNLKGQKVKQLVSDQLSAGQHSVIWNGKDDSGKSVSSGIYFYKLKTENYEKTKKMILLR